MTLNEFLEFAEQQKSKIENEQKQQDVRFAQLMCLLANINRDSKKRQKPYTVHDFLPCTHEEEKKAMDINVMAKLLEGFTEAHGGEVKI